MKLRQQHHFLFLTYLLTTTSASHLRRRAKNSTQNADLDLDLPPVNVTNSTLSSLETAVDEVKSELAALESSDDSQLNDDEFESKMEQEEELLNEEFALDEEIDELEDEGEAADDLVEEGGWDDDLVGELGGEELEDELEEIEEEIEELEEEDDDGQDALMKEALVEELQDIKGDIEEVIEEGDEHGDDDGYEVFSSGQSKGNATNTVSKANITAAGLSTVSLGGKDSLPNVNIDPMLTMDLTQYNPPGDADTKESFSDPSVMESGVDRHGVNGTMPAKASAAEVSEQDDDDDFVPPGKNATVGASVTTDDDDFITPSKVSSVAVQSTNNTVVQDESDPVLPNDDDDFVSPSKASSVAVESTNKTVVQDESDDHVLPSLTKSKNATEEDDDDDYVPLKSSSSTQGNVPNSTGTKETVSDQDDDDEFSPVNKDETLYEEGMPPELVNASTTVDFQKKNATSASSFAASKDSSTGSNTTASHKNNSTVHKPISEPEESATQTNTSIVENEESIVDSETVTATTTASETTSEAATTTEAASTTATVAASTTAAAAATTTTAKVITTLAPVKSTPAPSPEPSYKPTIKAYESADDEIDPVVSEQNIIDNEAFSDGEVSTPASGGGRDIDDFLREEEEEVRKVGGWMGFAAVVLAVWTAYQMSENPDGICASICRLVITVMGCIVKVILIPFKYLLGGRGSSGGHYMATPSYRDPYGSRHLELT